MRAGYIHAGSVIDRSNISSLHASIQFSNSLKARLGVFKERFRPLGSDPDWHENVNKFQNRFSQEVLCT